MTVSKGREEKTRVVHSGTRSISDGFYRCPNERFKVTKSSNLWVRLVSLVMSYCCNILEGKKRLVCGMGLRQTVLAFCVLLVGKLFAV